MASTGYAPVFFQNSFKLKRIAYLVPSLEGGGAEGQLARIAAGLDRNLFEVTVLCFSRKGPWTEFLDRAGVRTISLDKRGRLDIPAVIFRFLKTVNALDIDIIHSFLAPANLVALLTKGVWPSKTLIWGIRSSSVDFAYYDISWRLTFELERALSWIPNIIIANSEAGKRHCVSKGFRGDHFFVIPNGIDTERFQPDDVARSNVRKAWGIAESEKLIGLAARLDPMKDHGNFLRAAALVCSERQDVRFVCIGSEGRQNRAELQALAFELGIADRLTWAGERRDMPAALAALDIHTSTSAFGEGFSNAVAEAMAVGVPSVVTDVGDSAAIVDRFGITVPPHSPQSLASGWGRLLDLGTEERLALSKNCRQRIDDKFSLSILVDQLSALYQDPVSFGRRESH